MKRFQIHLNKPNYLGIPMLEWRKTIMHEYWYDYVKPKDYKKAKLFDINISFICFICVSLYM